MPRITFPITRNTRSGSRNVPAHLFRRLIQPPDHPHAELRRRQQILTPLPGRIQPGDRLIQVRANPPHQPSRRHQLAQRLPQRRSRPGLDAHELPLTSPPQRTPPAPARPCSAAPLTSSNSSCVSENCTTFGRGTASRDRRRTTPPPTMTTPIPHRRLTQSGPRPVPRRLRSGPAGQNGGGGASIVYLWTAPGPEINNG